MAIGAEIFAQMGARPKSMGEYREELDRQDANALSLKAGNLTYQNALQAAQDEAAYRDIAKTFGTDTAANYNALLKASPKHAQAYQKSVLDAQKTQADIKQSNAAAESSQSTAAKNRAEVYQSELGLGMKILQAATTPQAAVQLVTQAVQSGQMKPDVGQRYLSEVPQDLNSFGQWRQGQLIEGMDIGKRLEQQRLVAEQAERARHNKATEGLAAAGQRQQMTIAKMVDDRQRDLSTITKEAAAVAKKEAADEKAVTKYSDTLQKEGIPELETAVGGAEAVMSKYKKGEVPGIGALKNALPAAAMSDEGKDVRQALAQVRNIVLSARSGAAVTDQELRRLVEEIGTGVGMSEDDIRRGLARVRARLETIKSNAAAGVSDEVKKTYEERGGVKVQRGGAKPAPSGDPVADALKKYGG